MNEQNYVADDEISLLDIYEFFSRHFITLCVVFVACFGSVAAYLLSQPTIYKTTVQLTIGKDLFFTTVNLPTNASTINLIESAEQTKHRFGSTVRIDAVKNTGILDIVAERTASESSLNDAVSVANQIVDEHKRLREQKVEQFKMLLSATAPSQSELMRVVDAAASSTPTRITNEPQTVALPYRGLLYKGLGIGIFAAAFVALLFALALDAKAKIKLARQQP
jgi:uncharacterized protein involved in exopolysaccharide biosynthesis